MFLGWFLALFEAAAVVVGECFFVEAGDGDVVGGDDFVGVVGAEAGVDGAAFVDAQVFGEFLVFGARHDVEHFVGVGAAVVVGADAGAGDDAAVFAFAVGGGVAVGFLLGFELFELFFFCGELLVGFGVLLPGVDGGLCFDALVL